MGSTRPQSPPPASPTLRKRARSPTPPPSSPPLPTSPTPPRKLLRLPSTPPKPTKTKNNSIDVDRGDAENSSGPTGAQEKSPQAGYKNLADLHDDESLQHRKARLDLFTAASKPIFPTSHPTPASSRPAGNPPRPSQPKPPIVTATPIQAFCPLPACPRSKAKGWRLGSAQSHLRRAQDRIHHFGAEWAPAELLQQHHRRVCDHCLTLAPRARKCPTCSKAPMTPPPPPPPHNPPPPHPFPPASSSAIPPAPDTDSAMTDAHPANPPPAPPPAHSPPPATPNSPPPTFQGPPLDEALATCASTIKFTPIAARVDIAPERASILRGMTSASDAARGRAWRQCFIFPKCCLFPPPRGGRKKRTQIAAILRARLARWRPGEAATLWAEAAEKPAGPAKSRGEKGSNDRKAQRAISLAADGAFSKAARALVAKDEIHPPSPSAATIMQQKRPPSPSPIASIPTPAMPPPSQIAPPQILSALRSFDKGANPGPGGLRHERVIDLLLTPSPHANSNAPNALTHLISNMASGQAPPQRARLAAAGALIALGHKRRPIPMGDTTRKMLSKTMATLSSSHADEALLPRQAGVGVKHGAEAIMHGANLITQALGRRKGLLLLKADFRSAFNMVGRSIILQEARKEFPGMRRWAHLCCNQEPALLHGECRIRSACGAQQGDPLAPLLFCLALQRIIQSIQTSCPGLKLSAWRMGDGRIVGSPDQIAAALDILQEQGPPLGLHARPSKCEMWWPSALENPFLPSSAQRLQQAGAKLHFGEGATALKAPIGAPPYQNSCAAQAAKEAGKARRALPTLDNSQVELALLRSAVGRPKLHYAIRAIPPSQPQLACRGFDDSQHVALQNIAASDLDPMQWLLAALPLSRGGLGIRATREHAEPARLASRLDAAPLIQRLLPATILAPLQQCRAEADEFAMTVRRGPDLPFCDASQRGLSKWATKNTFDHALHMASHAEAPLAGQARAQAGALPRASAWAAAMPSESRGAIIDSRECRALIRGALGVKQLPAENPVVCPFCHQAAIDPEGHHMLMRKRGGGPTHRRNLARGAFASLATEAGLHPRAEAPHLAPSSRRRPGDAAAPNWSKGRPAAFDAPVTSPLQQSLAAKAAREAGVAAEARRDSKMESNEADCKKQGINFIPLVVEAFGGWAAGSIQAIKELAQRLADVSARARAQAIRHAFERLSVTLQRSNASLIAQALDLTRGATLPATSPALCHYSPTIPASDSEADADI